MNLGFPPWGGSTPYFSAQTHEIYYYYYYFSCYATVSLNFGRCPTFKLTTHSPRMVNNHYHAHTPDSTRCYCAYEMQICNFMPYHATCIMRATCNISKSWIIIFSTYNFHSLYISCQYIKQAYVNMIFTQTAGYSFFQQYHMNTAQKIK